MTSYFGATESKTPRTRSALARSSTVLKPKWVSLIALNASGRMTTTRALPPIGASRSTPSLARRSSYFCQSSACCEPRKYR